MLIREGEDDRVDSLPAPQYSGKSRHLQMCSSSSDNYTSNPALMAGYLEPNAASLETKSDAHTALSQRAQPETWRRQAMEQGRSVHAYLNILSNQESEDREAYQIQNVDERREAEQQLSRGEMRQHKHLDAPLQMAGGQQNH